MLDYIESQMQECVRAIERVQRDIERYTEDKRIAARDGDLRENDAYQVAINAIEQSNGELFRIQERLNALNEFNNLNPVNTGYAALGSVVTIFREDTQEMFKFTLVPTAIGDAEKALIAIDSLLGRKVIGTQVGNNILVNTGIRSYKALIVSIE